MKPKQPAAFCGGVERRKSDGGTEEKTSCEDEEAQRGRAASKTNPGNSNREIHEKREKQEDEEISRGDAENAERKKRGVFRPAGTSIQFAFLHNRIRQYAGR